MLSVCTIPFGESSLRHLWEFAAFFGLNCSISGLTTTFDYSPLGIAFHPRGFTSPVVLICLPFFPRSRRLQRTRAVATFTHFRRQHHHRFHCSILRSFLLLLLRVRIYSMHCASTSWYPPLPFTSQPPLSALLWRAGPPIGYSTNDTMVNIG